MDSVTRCPCHKEQVQKTVPEIIEEVKDDVCDYICKWPERYYNYGALLKEKCETCALNRL